MTASKAALPTYRRVWTQPGQPYPGIEFVERPVTLTGPNVPKAITAPEVWSQSAVDILASKYLHRAGVPKAVAPVGEPGVPAFLQPMAPTATALFGGETDARQAFHRLAGCWAYWGYKLGYFGRPGGPFPPGADTPEGTAAAFYDEVLYMLAAQIWVPASPQWFNTGLNWAYGITAPDSGQYAIRFTDNGDGTLAPRSDGMPGSDTESVRVSYTRPAAHACFILGVEDDLAGPGGILDTLNAEARIFKFGGGSGSNFSKLRGRGEPLSRGGVSSGPLSFLKVNDAGGGAIKSGGVTRRAAKMVCFDIDHPDIVRFIRWKAEEEYRVACVLAGDAVIRDTLPAVAGVYASAAKRAAAGAENVFGDGFDMERYVQTAFANTLADRNEIDITAPNARYVPHATRRRAELAAVQPGGDVKPVWPDRPYSPHFEGDDSAYETAGGQNANNSVRVTNGFMQAVVNGEGWNLIRRTDGGVSETVSARWLWDLLVRAAWTCADPGVQWHTTINEWNPCAADGDIDASNPCAEYNFLDDTACNLGSVRLTAVAVTGSRGEIIGVDLIAYRHACELATTVLDITVSMAGYPTERVAEGSRKYRTLGLGYTDLGAFLMRAGVGYDSDAGRAWCAALTSLMHSAATARSAGLAAQLGAFPRHAANKEHVDRVTWNHAVYAHRVAGTEHLGSESPFREYRGLSITPPYPAGAGELPRPVLRAVGDWAADAAAAAGTHGLRNAQLTLLAPTGTIGFVLDCDTTGIEPDFALVKSKKLVGGGYMKIVNGSLPAALAALGYDEAAADDITRYVFGTRRLPDGATGTLAVNAAALHRHGVTGDELDRINAALKTADSLDAAVTAVTGRSVFDIMAPDDSGPGGAADDDLRRDIAEASAEICGTGTVENAPHLRPGHYGVFDCATPCGSGRRSLSPESHVRMVAAAQPALSGGVSKTINLPPDATLAELDGVYRLSHSLMTKCTAAYIDGQKLSQPMAGSPAAPAATRVKPIRVFGPPPSGGAPPMEFSQDDDDPDTMRDDEFDTDSKAEPARPPVRVRLPNRRPGYTQTFKIGGHRWYLRTGDYPDGRLGEIFITSASAGGALRAVGDALAIAVSLGLQHGVPLEEYVDAYLGMKFEPAGVVQDHARVKMGGSFLDVIFRDLAVSYLGRDELAHVQLATAPTDTELTAGVGDESKTFSPAAPAGASERVPAAVDPFDAMARRHLMTHLKAQRVSPVDASRRAGYTGDVCGQCKEFMMRQTGICKRCDNCGWSNGGCG